MGAIATAAAIAATAAAVATTASYAASSYIRPRLLELRASPASGRPGKERRWCSTVYAASSWPRVLGLDTGSTSGWANPPNGSAKSPHGSGEEHRCRSAAERPQLCGSRHHRRRLCVLQL